MIDLEFVEKLIRSMDESTLDSIEIERGGTRIRLAKSPPAAAGNSGAPAAASVPVGNPAPAPAPGSVATSAPSGDSGGSTPDQATESGSSLVAIPSPMVGTFYRSPSPDADPFTRTGASVSAGDVLCIIEAMKLMNELEAEVAGTIREICVEDGEPVEYGQVLFRVEPA